MNVANQQVIPLNHDEIKGKAVEFYKISGILGFIAVLLAVIFAWNTPASGYESSIYLSTPLISWIFLAIGFGFGVGIVLFKTGEKDKRNNEWLLGFLLILLVNIVILSLPAVRNYFLWDGAGDTGEHLGFIQDSLAFGHTASTNFYPLTHILLAQISLVLGTEPMSLFRWVLLLFAGLSFISIYLICRELLSNKRQMAIAALAGCILFQNWPNNLAPNSIGNILFPFFIFVLIEATIQTFQWTVCLILLVLFIIPLHPVPALAFLLVVITIWLWYKVKSKFRNHKPFTFRVLGVPLILLFTVWLIVWMSSFGVWDATISNIYTLMTEGSQTHLQSMVNDATYAMQYGYNVFNYFIKLYGGTIVYVFLAAFGFTILKRRTSKNHNSYLLTPIAWNIVIIVFVMLSLYFLNLAFGPQRLEAYIIFLCPPFVGIALGSVIDSPSWLRWSRSARVICVGLLLTALSISAVLILYPSPYILSASYQNTRSEITGMDWFLHKKDVNIFSTGWFYSPSIYSSYLLTSEERMGRNDLSPYVTKPFPYRLGYDKNKELGQSYGKDVILVMTELTRKVYKDVFPKMASLRLTTDDLNQLEEDTSVDRLYTNKGFDIYYVHAK